jgi:hypothetical protein
MQPPTAKQLLAGAGRFAGEVFRMAVERCGTTPNVVQEREGYRAMLEDAYLTGAIEALKMERGDFTAEPWFKHDPGLERRMLAIPKRRIDE